jgi:hypothetical protein
VTGEQIFERSTRGARSIEPLVACVRIDEKCVDPIGRLQRALTLLLRRGAASVAVTKLEVTAQSIPQLQGIGLKRRISEVGSVPCASKISTLVGRVYCCVATSEFRHRTGTME